MDIDPDAILDHESAQEYARFHGLCLDYTSEDFNLCNLAAPPDCDIDRDFQNLSKTIATDTLRELIRERLTVSKEAAVLLKDIHSPPTAPPDDSLTQDQRKWIRGIKQEIPLLATDPELDLLEFGNTAMPDLRNLRIPSEATNRENDEGMEWPSKYLGYLAQWDNRIKAEKLTVTKKVLVYLQDAIRDDHIPTDTGIGCLLDYKYKANTGAQPVTPPLLPLSPPLTPYIPSSPANKIPLPSSSSGSLAAEAKALERQIMDADSFQRVCSDSSDSMLLDITDAPQFSPLSQHKEPSILKRRPEHLKVEGPLTPPMFSSSPMKKLKSVSFSNMLTEYIPTMKMDESMDDGVSSSVDFDDYDELLREIEPLAAKARMRIENEQLSGADTTARVNIPDMDFSLPIAPWEEYSRNRVGRRKIKETELDAQSTFLLRIKREDLKTATSWHGISALERELRWTIFTPRPSSVNLEEQLHGETEWNNIFAELKNGDITTSFSLVWKRDGLRLFDVEEEEEEELELEEEGQSNDIEALIRKRKLEMEEDTEMQVHKRTTVAVEFCGNEQNKREILENKDRRDPVPTYPKTLQHKPPGPQPSFSRLNSTQPSKDTGAELMFGGFSASTALQKFMETRGKAVKAIIPAQTQCSSGNNNNNPHTIQTLPVRSREPSHEVPATTTPDTSHPLPIKQPMHLVTVPENLPPCSIIVSSILLQRRTLCKKIEHLYPSAEIIYRDYTLPHSPSDEADMILSPSTGLLFTTLQQVKQRALPGQPDRSALKERILALQLRYERLLIMISEGLTREMEERGSPRPADPRDEEALGQFEAFSAAQEGDLQVEFVKGGEHGFAISLVRKMAEFGLPHGSVDIGDIKPLAVETSWECFLRRAGLNPFAAQVIIASLKTPIEIQSLDPFYGRPEIVQVSGLPAFLMMREEERVRYFQAIMGGGRVLRKVSRMVDQEWLSAAHGYRLR